MNTFRIAQSLNISLSFLCYRPAVDKVLLPVTNTRLPSMRSHRKILLKTGLNRTGSSLFDQQYAESPRDFLYLEPVFLIQNSITRSFNCEITLL